jgi:hypothetical protein
MEVGLSLQDALRALKKCAQLRQAFFVLEKEFSSVITVTPSHEWYEG